MPPKNQLPGHQKFLDTLRRPWHVIAVRLSAKGLYMPIHVACKCGCRFVAKDDAAGMLVRCPKCKQNVPVHPTSHISSAAPAAPPAPPIVPRRAVFPRDLIRRVEPVLVGLLLASVGVLTVSILLAMYSIQLAVLAISIWSLMAAGMAISVLSAKSRALQGHEANCLFGLAKVIAWDPTQGVVLLKDKTVFYVDSELDG